MRNIFTEAKIAAHEHRMRAEFERWRGTYCGLLHQVNGIFAAMERELIEEREACEDEDSLALYFDETILRVKRCSLAAYLLQVARPEVAWWIRRRANLPIELPNIAIKKKAVSKSA